MRLLLRVGPWAILAAAAAWIWSAWGELPRRYPVHWGTRGVDRWADLSVRSVAAPILMGAVGIVWIGLLGRFVLANSSPVPDNARSRLLTQNMSVGVQWFLATVFGLAAVPREGPGLVVAGTGLAFLFVSVALVVTYAGAPPPVPDDPPEPPEGGWLFVPRGNGAGLGIVRHHPKFWQAVALVAAGPILLSLAGWLA